MPSDQAQPRQDFLLEAATVARENPTDAAYAALEAAVCDFVTDAKARGEEITHILVDVKRTLDEAGLTSRRGANAEAAFRHAVATCIEHFYKPVR